MKTHRPPARPPRHIYSPAFVYVPAAKTDIAKTFARIRRELARSGGAAVLQLERKR